MDSFTGTMTGSADLSLQQIAAGIVRAQIKANRPTASELPEMTRAIFEVVCSHTATAPMPMPLPVPISHAPEPEVYAPPKLVMPEPLPAPGAPDEPPTPPRDLIPAVPIRESVFPDYVVCLECAKQYKTLKAHLREDHGLVPDDYRARWNLPENYPLVAPAYSERRSAISRNNGFGAKKPNALLAAD